MRADGYTGTITISTESGKGLEAVQEQYIVIALCYGTLSDDTSVDYGKIKGDTLSYVQIQNPYY
jgi:hypothetical protein